MPLGANPDPRVVGLEPLPGVTNYFIGNDPRKWRTNVPGYAKVKYESVYPGIDLVYYGNEQGHLEYDFLVAPGANPDQIALTVEAAEGVQLEPNGDLIITAATGTIRKPAPRVYQEIDGKRREIAAGYRLIDGTHTLDRRYSTLGSQKVAFAVGAYDKNLPLVIDPQILYATYLGGSSNSTIANEGARGVAADAQGSVYVVGVTQSANFPTKNPEQGTLQGFTNAFITKLDANGQLVYSTYLGGSGFDEGAVIKVDDTGAVYVGGTTSSVDFPSVNPALPRGGRNDGFITKLSPNGSQIVFSTYIGGTDN
ncbi:MAG TPA: SBBP repeat-containing protein, partial [Candidatus Binatia bacterium]